MKLVAFHNDPKIKAKYIRRVEDHRKADELTQGVGWESNGVTRGCAVGCTFDAYDHSRGPVEIGYPEVLMRMEDTIFEGLPQGEAMAWPTKFLEAAKPGADLSLVHHQFFAWLLSESGLLTIDDLNREAIATVADLHRRAASGEKITRSLWESAARSVRATLSSISTAIPEGCSSIPAGWSARSAGEAAEAESAEDAAAAAVKSAKLAVAGWSLRSAAEASSNSPAAWKEMATKLLELIAAQK